MKTQHTVIARSIAALAAALVVAGANAQETPRMLEETVVTAQKREQALMDVPLSVQAITAEDLATRGTTDYSDLLQIILSASFVSATAPGFETIQMRGIANARYQGQHVVAGEAELNWRVHDRWHLIGFIGSGKAFGENKLREKDSFSDADWNSSKGIGFRYEIARKFGMQVGVDVAWGPEDTAVYVTMGSAWNSFF